MHEYINPLECREICLQTYKTSLKATCARLHKDDVKLKGFRSLMHEGKLNYISLQFEVNIGELRLIKLHLTGLTSQLLPYSFFFDIHCLN